MNCPFYSALLPVNGRGLFTRNYFPIGSILFKAFNLDGTRTPMAQYLSQTQSPNIQLRRGTDGLYAVSILPIFAGHEISYAL